MSTALLTVPESLSADQVPELRAGDRLSRAEFERRYAAMPQIKKAELIEGVVYMPSPVTQEDHGGPHFDVIAWLGVYRIATTGVQGGDNSTLRLDLKNEPQPDVFMRILPEFGGQSGNSGKYVAGAPELIFEVAASSASYDLHDKLSAYQRNGVCEYVVWRVWDREIDWFVLRENGYERLELDTAGHYRSVVFPGLWLDPAALICGDMMQVDAVLQQGLASAEHAAFVSRLERQRASQT
jgi:Uma2 family endonuclease